MLVQYKSSVSAPVEPSLTIYKLVQAVLKRVLRVSHPLLQLHVLKLIKSQVPFCGRKWRQCMCDDTVVSIYTYPLLANMKVITSIYLNCRPDLRDEWLTGTEVDDISDAQVCDEFRR